MCVQLAHDLLLKYQQQMFSIHPSTVQGTLLWTLMHIISSVPNNSAKLVVFLLYK